MPEPRKRQYVVLLAPVLAAVFVAAGVAAYLSRNIPDNPAESWRLSVDDFQVLMGSGSVQDGQVTLEEFADGYALLSSGPLSLEAENYRFLTVTLYAPAETDFQTLFWRRSDAPQQLVQWRIREFGTSLIDLSSVSTWKGEISEIGLLLGDVGAGELSVGPMLLAPDSLGLRLRRVWDGWTAFEHWTQKSINFMHGGGRDQLVSLSVVLSAWVSLSFVLVWLLMRFSVNRSSRSLVVAGTLFFLLGWMLLDVRWTANSVRQVQHTLADYSNAREDERLGKGLDGELYRYIQQLKADVLPDHPARILVLGGERFVDYFLKRAKYHLLPHKADSNRRIPDPLTPESLDYIVFLGTPEELGKVPGWSPTWQQGTRQVKSGQWGQVYEVIH